MDRIFSMDSPVIRFLNRVGDLLILNFLVMFCCIPVITAGAAFTGMHYVLLKIVRDEEGYLVKGFFKSFKQNFKQATILWMLILFAIIVYVGDVLIFNYSGLEFPKVFAVLIMAVAIVLLMTAVYIFPILARFDNTIKNTLKNAFLMAFLNLPKTLLMVLLIVLPFIILHYSAYSSVFVFMFGFSLPAYASALLYSKIFKKFEPEDETVVSDYEFSVNTEGESEEGNA